MAKKLEYPASGSFGLWLESLPAKYQHIAISQKRGETPGLKKIRHDLDCLDVIGHVNKHSLPKPKRKVDDEFRRWYHDRGEDIDAIKMWRNANFTGEEAYTAFAKYNHPEPDLSGRTGEAFRLATSWMATHFYPYMCTSDLLNFHQVIDGTEGSGSPGFPWNTSYKTCEEFYASDDFDIVYAYWDRSRYDAFCVWNSFLKEELRKIAKIEQGDIRQINGCPVEFKLAMNAYCLNQNQKFYDSHLSTASAVGINKFHKGWDALFHKLSRFPSGYALDVKRWDSHFPRCLFERIRDFRFSCLSQQHQTPEHHQRFTRLYEQIIRSATVMSWGEVIATRLGNPSGSPNTVVDNTLGLYALVAFCWIRSCQEAGLETDYGNFQEEVVMALYGDDNTFTASEGGLQLLSPTLVKRFALELGFVVTSDSEVPKPVMELDFLSSRFHRLPNGLVVWKPKDPEKAKASLAYRGDGNLFTTWSRACAHRINSYWEASVYEIADQFCRHLLHRIDAVVGKSDREWQRLKPEYLSDHQIYKLFTTAESRAQARDSCFIL